MIDLEETVTEIQRARYVVAMPDTSNATADVEGDIVTLTYAGGSLTLPLDGLSVITALTAAIAAGVRPAPDAPGTPQEPVQPELDIPTE